MNADEPDLRELRCLCALAEEGTFTDAAIRLGTSQPAVSRAIARLEEAVGAPLVLRTTRSVSLTPAGDALYRAVRGALGEIDVAIETARGRPRTLRIGYSWAAFGRLTGAILRQWRDDRPDVPIEVHRIDERFAGLSSGRVDVAVVRGSVDAQSLQSELLFTENRVAAVPIGHPLADRARLNIDELTGTVALTPTTGTTTVDLWPAPARPTSTVGVDNLDEWLTVIASGAAVGVTAESTAFLHPNQGVVFVPLSDVAAITVNLAWPIVHPHPAVGPFAEHVRHCARAG